MHCNHFSVIDGLVGLIWEFRVDGCQAGMSFLFVALVKRRAECVSLRVQSPRRFRGECDGMAETVRRLVGDHGVAGQDGAGAVEFAAVG